jgi:hypothetical protein
LPEQFLETTTEPGVGEGPSNESQPIHPIQELTPRLIQ